MSRQLQGYVMGVLSHEIPQLLMTDHACIPTHYSNKFEPLKNSLVAFWEYKLNKEKIKMT